MEFESGTKYNWNIAGSSVDTISVAGDLTLPDFTEAVQVIVDRSEAVNGTYTLISSSGISGGDETAFYSSDENVEFTKVGNDIKIVVTPEPGMVIGLILAGLAIMRARKQ